MDIIGNTVRKIPPQICVNFNTAQIHEGLGFDYEPRAATGNENTPEQGVELGAGKLFRPAAIASFHFFQQHFHCYEAYIVACTLILGTGVAEAYDDTVQIHDIFQKVMLY